MHLAKRVFVACGILACLTTVGLLVAIGVFWYQASQRLAAEIASIRASGAPATVSDLMNRPPIPDEENAAIWLARAKDDVAIFEERLAPIIKKENESHALTDDDFAAIRVLLREKTNAVAQLRRAAQCDHYRPAIPFDTQNQVLQNALMQACQEIRRASRVLQRQTQFDQRDGQSGQALESCMAMIRLGRLVQGQLAAIGFSVGVAVASQGVLSAHDVLQSARITAALRDRLDSELAQCDTAEAHHSSLGMERVLTSAQYQQLSLPVLIWRDHSRYLEIIGEQMRLVDASYDQANAALARFESQPPSRFHVLSQMHLPAIRAHRIAADRFRAWVRSLRILNALQRDADAGRQASFDQVVLANQAKIDPFSGQPLIVKRAPAGWLIYSVGENMKDDGGRFENHEDVGLGAIAKQVDSAF